MTSVSNIVFHWSAFYLPPCHRSDSYIM